MSHRRWSFAVLIAALLFGAPLLQAPTTTAETHCIFTLGFKALRDQMLDVVGDCLENEQHNATTGDALQRTQGGLLVWRKADNWTAFTNGSTTWINGPSGLVSRSNAGPLFEWEKPVAAPAQPAASRPTAVATLAPTAAPAPWVGDIKFGFSGSGTVPAGSSLKVKENSVLVGYFSWRGLPPGSTLRVEVVWGKQLDRAFDLSVGSGQGSSQAGIVRYGNLADGNWSWNSSDFTLVIYHGGREMARGFVHVD